MPPERRVCAANGVGGLDLLRDGRWTQNGCFGRFLDPLVSVLPNFALVQERLNSSNADPSLKQVRDHSWQKVERPTQDDKDSHGREGHRWCKLLVLQLCVRCERHDGHQDRRSKPQQSKDGVDDIESDKSTQLLIANLCCTGKAKVSN